MLYLGIDPGLTIGWAIYDPTSGAAEVGQGKHPREVYEAFSATLGAYPHSQVVIEDYLSAGHLTKEAKHTLEVLGYFKYSPLYPQMKVVPPQRRKPYVRAAATLLGGGFELENDKSIKDGLSALAHCLAEAASQ